MLEYIEKTWKKCTYRFVPFFNHGNSNGRCSGAFVTRKTCVTVPVMGGCG